MALGRRNPNEPFQKLLDAAAQARLPHEREWWLNLAFYLNRQYVEWSDDTRSIREIPRDKANLNAPRPLVNKIMHYVQQEKAMVLQAKPVPDPLPATDDLMNISFASVAKAYCSHVSEPTMANFPRQLSRATLWSVVTGNGFLKWTFNDRDKHPEINPPSPFELFFDPYAKDFGKARYLIHSQFMDIEQVYEAWGVEVKPNDVQRTDELRTSLMRSMGSSPVLSGVTVNEIWQKPCRRYPKGLYAVWAGNEQLVQPGPHPYDHKRLPYTQIGCIERPDSPYYQSPVTYLRSAQMALNQYHAQKISNRRNFSNPKYLIPDELEMQKMPDDSPNQILRYNSLGGALEPKILQAAAMPDNGDGEMIETQMMHIVGLHEVSQAQVPGRVEAAKAIEMLKEADADRQATMLDTINFSVSEGFYQILRLAKQYVSEDVLVTTYSRDGLPEVKAFKAAKMDAGMKVQVTTGTGLARSRAARQDLLMNMWMNKIITDPELMAELMEVPIPSFAEPRALDRRLARNENLELSRAQAVTANSWDDHAIHLREHNDFRKTSDYLVLKDPAKERFEFHCQQHEKLQIIVAQKQAMLMMAMTPQQPTGPGGAPAPPGDAAAPGPAGTETATPPEPGGTIG